MPGRLRLTLSDVAKQIRRSKAYTKRLAMDAGVVLKERRIHYTDTTPRTTRRRWFELLSGGDVRRIIAELNRRARKTID